MCRLLPAFTFAFLAASASPGAAASPSASQATLEHSCPQGERSALSEMGCEIQKQLTLADTALLTAGPIRADVVIERPDELVERTVRVLGGSLGPSLQLHPAAVSLGEAHRLAARHGRLLYLSLELRQGRLHLTADLYARARAFWDRVKSPVSGPMEHAYAERPADGEIRSFLPRAPLVVSQRHSAPLPERPILSIACGDLKEESGPALALIGRRRISFGRLRSGRLEHRREREWQDLSPIAPNPLRAPLVSSRIHRGWLDVGSSDRAHVLRLGPGLTPVAKAPRALPWPQGGCAPLETVAASLKLSPCFQESTESHLLEELQQEGVQAPGMDAFASTQVVDEKGTASHVTVVRPAGRSEAWLMDGAGRSTRVAEVGVQLALGDIDGDGNVELVSSRPVLDPTNDSLRVDTWQADGSLQRRYEIALPDIQAIAVCPWEGDGLSSIAVAAADRVWVLK